MAKINSYPFDSTIQDADAWIGTDSTNRSTKQYTAEAVAAYTIGGLISGGTINTLPIFTSTGLADSLVSQDNIGIVYIGTQASGTRFTNTSISTPNLLGTDLYVANIYGQNGGLLSIQGNAIIGNEATDLLQIISKVSDSTGSASSVAGQVLFSTAAGQLVWGNVSGGTVKGTGTVNFVSKWSATDTLQDSIIFDNGTNVGIGTNSPDRELDVIGGISAQKDGQVFYGKPVTGLASAITEFSNSTGSLEPRIKLVNSAGTTKIVLDGANSPGGGVVFNTTLDVVNDSSVSGAAATITNNSESPVLRLVQGGLGGNFIEGGNAGASLFSINSQGHIGIGVNNASGAIQAKGIIRADAQSSDTFGIVCFNSAVTAGSGIYFNNDNAQVILKDSTNVVNAKISSDGFSWFNGGGVGFGTTTPAAPIEMVVNDASGKGLLLSNVGDNSDYDSVRFTYSGFNAGSPEFIFTPKTQPSAGLTNTFFRFKTNGGASIANVANVSIDGKLGVGTTTPLANLDVKETTTNVAGQIIVGGLIESSTDDIAFGKLCFANTAAANSQPNKILASIEGRKNGSSNRGILTFGMADGSGSNWEKMRIDSYGYVGIGTTDPQRELDVAGDVGITGILELLQKNSNTFVGTDAGNLSNTTGGFNVALGSESLNNNTGGNGNTAVGRQTLHNSTGNNNTGTGSLALFSNTTGKQNTGIGRQALQNVTTGDCNVGIGHIAGALVNGGAENTNPFYSVFIGGGTKSKTNNDTNQIVIGRNAIGEGTNTARIGNTSVSQLHVGGNGAGIVLKSPNGTAYIIKVTDAGALTVTAL